jgi:hypothetical protein
VCSEAVTPLDEALGFMGIIGGVDIAFDEIVANRSDEPTCMTEFSLPLEAAVAWTVRLAGLEHEIRGGTAVVSTPKGLGFE